MIVSNAVYPTQEQFRALLESDFTGAVCMVNLLEFKAQEKYEDGRPADLTVADAYGLYGEQMRGFCRNQRRRISVPGFLCALYEWFSRRALG